MVPFGAFNMDRREFLKILGLGGVALTMPKPLGVIAAKMEDIKGPPLHVGRCEIGPLSDDSFGNFVMQGVSLTTKMLTMTVERYKDFHGKWTLAMRYLSVEGHRTSTLYFQVPVRHIPDTSMIASPLAFSYLASPLDFMWRAGDVAEFWVTPSNRYNLPKYPLPDIVISVHGWRNKRKDGIVAHPWTLRFWARVETVQLDRARALEMGLVDRDEPEGVIE